MSRYWTYSKSAYYGVMCALPLLAIYEALLWAASPPGPLQVRNAADAWLRMLFESLGVRPAYATLAMIGLLAAAIPRLRRSGVRLEGRYLLGMAGEMIVYSLALGIVINIVLTLLFSAWASTLHARLLAPAIAAALPPSEDLRTGIALSLGAGLFEEFAFRVVLLNLLLGLFRIVLPAAWAALVAVLLAALAFSLAHYPGALGEPFTLYSMLYRWLAGLLFTLLYYQRGFAITAWSHALYDVWVLLI